MTVQQMRSIAWIGCSASYGDGQLPDAVSALASLLREQSMHVVLFGARADSPKYRGLHVVELPPLLSEQGQLFAGLAGDANVPLAASSLGEFVKIDENFGSVLPPPAAELYTARSVAFWERAFEIMQPSVVVVANPIEPLNRLLFRIGQRHLRPTFNLDQSPFEGAIWLSASGQTALSCLNTQPSLIAPNSRSQGLKERWCRVQAYYAQRRPTNYVNANQSPDPDQQASLRSDGQPRILFLGASDRAAGYGHAQKALGACFTTWVDDSHGAAHAVSRAL